MHSNFRKRHVYAREGFRKGELGGISGYKPQDPNVRKLEPEGLNATCLNKINEANTLEGAISQMQSNAEKQMNPWRSKTAMTTADIQIRKKVVRFEDLNLLEKRAIKQEGPAAAPVGGERRGGLAHDAGIADRERRHCVRGLGRRAGGAEYQGSDHSRRILESFTSERYIRIRRTSSTRQRTASTQSIQEKRFSIFSASLNR